MHLFAAGCYRMQAGKDRMTLDRSNDLRQAKMHCEAALTRLSQPPYANATQYDKHRAQASGLLTAIIADLEKVQDA